MPSEELFGASFDAAPIGQCLLAPTGTLEILAVNEAFLAPVGRSRGDLVGRALFDAFPNDPDNPHSGVAKLIESIQTAIRTGKSHAMPAQRYSVEMDRNGKRAFEDMYWSATNTPVYGPEGTLRCILHTTIDITEKVKSEQLLRESEDRFQAYVSASSDVFYQMSPDWKYMQALDGRNFLKPTAAWGEYRIEDYVHPLDLALVRESLRDAIDNKHAFELEHRVLRNDGTLGWTYSRAVPRLDENGTIFEWIGSAVDITERKLADEQLKQADRQKDEFLAMLAHELRNPLAPIGAAAELLQRAPVAPDTVHRTSEVIGRQVQHMTALIDDLLDVSRVTRGLVKLDCTELDVRQIVTEAVEQVTPLIQSRRHRLVLHVPPQTTLVKGDKKRLIQVVSNLLNNAAKYNAEGGTITLKVDVRSAHVLVEVTDNGVGMTPEMASRAFDLFSQAERSSDRSSGGLGIGLALVKSLAELHQGRATCESAGPGMGSKFTVCLPRLDVPETAQARNETSTPAPSPRPMEIMVVDDNVDAATMLAMVMEALGHHVTVEHGAKAALENARSNPPQVFLLDIGLPEIDGIELARRLRSRTETSRSVLIAVTGYGQDEDRKRTAEVGFDHHLVKPVDIRRLESILAQVG